MTHKWSLLPKTTQYSTKYVVTQMHVMTPMSCPLNASKTPSRFMKTPTKRPCTDEVEWTLREYLVRICVIGSPNITFINLKTISRLFEFQGCPTLKCFRKSLFKVNRFKVNRLFCYHTVSVRNFLSLYYLWYNSGSHIQCVTYCSFIFVTSP